MFPYKNPITPIQVIGTQSVSRDKSYGTNFSILSTGGYMEVYSLDQLTYTVPPSTYGQINFSGNSIPINFFKGSGTTFSVDTLTLNSDNISSGRKKLGMLVYVRDENQVYQFDINNYQSLWNSATGATGIGGNTVIISSFGTTVKANSPEGIAFISGWTANTIDGVSGVSRNDAVWKKYHGTNLAITGGTYSSGTLTLTNITGGTINVTGFSGGGDSITGGTFDYNTGTLSLNSTGTTVTITGFTDVYITGGTYNNSVGIVTFTNNSGGTFNVTGFYTGNTNNNYYLPLSGGTVTGNTIFNNPITANTITTSTLNGVGLPTAIEVDTYFMYDSSSLSSIDWTNRLLFFFDGITTSIDWGAGYMNDTSGITSLDWENGRLTDTSTSLVSVDWKTRTLKDSSSNIKYDWENGVLTGVTQIESTTISATTYQNLPSSGLITKSNIVSAASFTGTPRKATITFTTPYTTTNYSISISGVNSRNFTYESKTTTGFVINTNANTALTGNVDWQTIEYGES